MRIYTVENLADKLQLKEKEILNLIDNKALAAKKIGQKYRITEEQLNEYLKTPQKVEADLINYKEIYDHAISGIALHEVIFDKTGKAIDSIFIAVNPAFAKQTGLKKEEVIGKKATEVLKGITENGLIDIYNKIVFNDTNKEFEKYSNSLNKWFHISAYCSQPKRFVTIFSDITEQKRCEEEIVYLSYHDILTGLYNRNYLKEQLNKADSIEQIPISIIMGDVNGLKLINDALGHKKGDQYIKSAAEVIEKSCRSRDIIVRYGGDEFVILLPQTSQQEASQVIKEINQRAEKVKINSFSLSIAFGSATKTESEQNLAEVLQEAEKLAYKQKLTDSSSARAGMLSTLLATLGEKSNETEEHSLRLSQYAFMLGEKLKLSDDKLDKLNLLATLHDIGKIAVPEKILKKPGKLTEKEWEKIKEHPEAGYRIVKESSEYSHIDQEILAHHERWDGGGYPQGLQGEEIPFLARIITIVDSYDVMTNERPYKKAMNKNSAIIELKDCAGSQFDPDLTKHFLDILKENQQL